MKHEPEPLKKSVDDNAKATCAQMQVFTKPIVDSIKIRGVDFTVDEARALYFELKRLFGGNENPPLAPTWVPSHPYYATYKSTSSDD